MLIDALQDYSSRMAMLGQVTGDASAFAEAVAQYRIYRQVVRDPESGLWCQGRGWREDRSALSPGHWSRGHGWLIRGMVDTLLLLPRESAEAMELRGYLKELADALVRVQQPDGMWHCLMNRSPSESPPEVSGTALIAGNLAIAVAEGFLEADTYEAAARRAFTALPRFVNAQGQVQSVSPGPGPLSEEEPWMVDAFEPGDEHGPFAILVAALGEELLDAGNVLGADCPNIVLLISDDHDYEHFGSWAIRRCGPPISISWRGPARCLRPAICVFDKVESRQMPPPVEADLPSDIERRKILDWIIDIAARPDPRLGARDPGKPILRRLTRLEYNNTVREMLQLDTDVFMLAERLPLADKSYFQPTMGKLDGPLTVRMREYDTGRNIRSCSRPADCRMTTGPSTVIATAARIVAPCG
jgi:hypothetical protein